MASLLNKRGKSQFAQEQKRSFVAAVIDYVVLLGLCDNIRVQMCWNNCVMYWVDAKEIKSCVRRVSAAAALLFFADFFSHCVHRQITTTDSTIPRHHIFSSQKTISIASNHANTLMKQ